MRALMVGMVLAPITALSGCMDDKPDINKWASYLQLEVEKTCSGRCSFVSVSKVDGRAMEMMGHKVYESERQPTRQPGRQLRHRVDERLDHPWEARRG
jgi:hypothetical protein